MVDAQTVGVLVTAASVTIAAIYYVLTLKTNQRTLKTNLETRQAQFYMQLYDKLESPETQTRFIDVLNWSWRDYDDYEKKYGSDEHPEMYGKRSAAMYEWGGIGWLLRKGVIDRDTAFTLSNGIAAIWIWSKFEPIIREQRVRYNIPEAWSDLEYLAMEMAKEIEGRGYSSKTPEGFAHYTGK